MSYRERVNKLLASFILIFGLLVSGISVISAQQSGGSGLQISPTRTPIVSISPGELKTESFTITNVTAGDTMVRVTLNDFESDNVTGEPKIIVKPGEPNKHSLQPFIKKFEDFELKAKESKVVKVDIDAPSNVSPGAYYGALRFTAVPGGADATQDRQVTLNASVASLIFAEVTGNITEQIQIKSVHAEQGGRTGNFFTKTPQKIAIEIQNSGNSFSQPFGRIAITDTKGKEVYSYELNNKDPRGNILPSSSRIFKDDLKNINRPGRYTITGGISHGNGGEVLSVKSVFWFIPLWLIFATIGLILVVAFIIYSLYKKKFSRQTNKRRS